MAKEVFIVTGRYGVQMETPEIFLDLDAAIKSCREDIFEVIVEEYCDELENDSINSSDVDAVLKWAESKNIYGESLYSSDEGHDYDFVFMNDHDSDWTEYQITTAALPDKKKHTGKAKNCGKQQLDPEKVYSMPLDGGHLDVRVSNDPQYPGLDIEYISDNEPDKLSRPRVLIEKAMDEASKRSGHLRAVIWADRDREDYTDTIDLDSMDQ